MTDTGGEVTRTDDRGTEEAGAEAGSRLQRYRERAEEWAVALRDGAEQHAPPEVLSGLAKTARDVARYLEGMAERARAKQAEPTEEVPEPTEQAESTPKD